MKLIIDIPEWQYKSICEGVEASKRCGVVGIDPNIHEAIYSGTPLDNLRAEIANHCGVNTDYCDSCRFCTDAIGVREILQIIDKCKAERSDKE